MKTNSKKPESNRSVMLSIARKALEERAKLDGYAPGDYDLESDPEGYVVSLLNALHHWCRANSIHWETELFHAEVFFLEDIRGEQYTACCPESIEELRCPKCGHEEDFIIEISECVIMFTDGTELDSDEPLKWNDRSFCKCRQCNYTGTVFQFWRKQQTG